MLDSGKWADKPIDVVVVGGGAAGFFAAIRLKELHPDLNVVIVEKTQKLLSKVRVSGGGRCNVTHNCLRNSELLSHYPRGKRILKEAFNVWNVANTITWFEKHGVSLKTEADGRMFPVTDSSETIAGLFEFLARKYAISVVKSWELVNLAKDTDGLGWTSRFFNKENESVTVKSDFVILAMGGQQQLNHYAVLQQLGVNMKFPVPSLFTFQIKDKVLTALSGVAVESGNVKLVGFDQAFQGPILVTHWGLSGPAILKTSAWAAEWLYEKQYQCSVLIGWVSEPENQFRELIFQLMEENAKKNIGNLPLPASLPSRIWSLILEKSMVLAEKKCFELNKAEKNKIVENTLRMPFEISGKTRFKEEFVTAGGIEDVAVHVKTMEVLENPGLYATGEFLNVDGVTGGFNFQAAWSTANLVAQSIARKKN